MSVVNSNEHQNTSVMSHIETAMQLDNPDHNQMIKFDTLVFRVNSHKLSPSYTDEHTYAVETFSTLSSYTTLDKIEKHLNLILTSIVILTLFIWRCIYTSAQKAKEN